MAASTKARVFNGTSDLLTSAATVDLSALSGITIAFRAYITDDTADRTMLSLADPFDNTAGSLLIRQNGTGNLYVFYYNGALAFGHIAIPSLNAWHQYAIVIDVSSTNNLQGIAYVDGSSVTFTVDQNTFTAGVFRDDTLLISSRSGVEFYHGRISEVAIWASGLSNGNLATYTTCGDPGAMSPAPAFWWPINQTSPEVASAGGVDMNVTGTTTADSGCVGGGPVVPKNSFNYIRVQY